MGAPVDLNLTFTGEDGYPVALRDYFQKGRPVILNLVYYNCPMLCTLILNGQTEAMRQIPWTPGNEYEIVTISIDPRETFSDARKKKAVYLGSFDRPAPGWHFLADHDGNALRLAQQVGVKYRYDPRQEQYAHPAVVMILTPEGRMARYLYGVRYSPRDIRFALAEASEGRVDHGARENSAVLLPLRSQGRPLCMVCPECHADRRGLDGRACCSFSSGGCSGPNGSAARRPQPERFA